MLCVNQYNASQFTDFPSFKGLFSLADKFSLSVCFALNFVCGNKAGYLFANDIASNTVITLPNTIVVEGKAE